MTVKFFGQFLLEKGKIIREELLDAIKFQKTINVKLGTIALEAGYLTANQVEHIRNQQQAADKLFGEIALELGYITSEQLEELLIVQKNECISLGDALLQKGYLSLSELETELKIFKQEEKNLDVKAHGAVMNAPDRELPEAFIDLTIKFLRRMSDIDVEITNSHNNEEKIAPHLWNVCQAFYGDSNGLYILSMSDKPLLEVASSIAQETLHEIDDFTKDGAKEFVNTLVGNSVAKLSKNGIKISLRPPEIYSSLGQINIAPESSITVSVKLASAAYDIQMSVAYSPITSKK